MNYQTLFSAWFAVIILWSVNTTNTQAQSSKEAIVLMQSVPTRVLVDADGTITKVIKTEPNYMAGYDVRPNDPKGTVNVATTTSSAPITSSPSYTNMLSFKDGEATLSSSILKELDKIADQLANTSRTVNFTTFSTKDQIGKSKLSNNRLDACKKYLLLKGVSSDKILNSSQIISNGDRGASKVAFVVE